MDARRDPHAYDPQDPCYTGTVKRNLTLTVDEDILLEARVAAARRRTSLSNLVRGFLTQLAGESERRASSWRRVRGLLENPPGRVGGKLPGRDELHER